MYIEIKLHSRMVDVVRKKKFFYIEYNFTRNNFTVARFGLTTNHEYHSRIALAEYGVLIPMREALVRVAFKLAKLIIKEASVYAIQRYRISLPSSIRM